LSEASAVVAGGVEAWGFNASGELGDGALGTATSPVTVDGLRGVTAIAAGGHDSLALLSNGTVMAWGENADGQLGDSVRSSFSDVPVAVPGLSGVVAVTAGPQPDDLQPLGESLHDLLTNIASAPEAPSSKPDTAAAGGEEHSG
jgi:hypothetical protein